MPHDGVADFNGKLVGFKGGAGEIDVMNGRVSGQRRQQEENSKKYSRIYALGLRASKSGQRDAGAPGKNNSSLRKTWVDCFWECCREARPQHVKKVFHFHFNTAR
jgi:hypothetical protein